MVAVVLALGCVGPERDGASVLRLLEWHEGTEVDWPQRLKPPPGLERSALAALPAPAQVAEVVMSAGAGKGGYDSRAALLAPRGASYRFRVRVPEDAVLRLGLGYVIDPAGSGRRIAFRVQVRPVAGGPATVLLAEEVTTAADGGWRDRRLGLAPWAGREVELELAVSRGRPRERKQPVWPAFAVPEIASAERGSRAPHVILISLDTLRADHLGCYGYRRPTSPFLDALAAGGFRFASAVAQAPWTRPSHRALFAGQYPLSRGEVAVEPLAASLWRAGYRTGAITGGGQVSYRFGFHHGFETYRVGEWVRAPELVTQWLDEAPERPTFLFLHTFEIHDPYDHATFAEGLPGGRVRPGFSRNDWWRLRGGGVTPDEKTYIEALYDGGIRFTDEALARLFAALEERGVLERSIVVVTSDHGEQFFEHDSWRHGSTVYDHQLLVPLIVHLPERLRRELGGGRVIDQQVELIDVYPTVLDLLGIPAPAGLQGRSLRDVMAGREDAEGERFAFAEHTNISRESKALRTRRWKFILSYQRNPADRDGEAHELYDLVRDATEQRNLAGQHPELVAELRARLDAVRGALKAESFEAEVPADADPVLRQELEALGYIGN